MRRRRYTAALAALTVGVGAALGVAACGEDRGSVEVEGSTTGGATTGGSTTGAATTGTVATGPTTTGGATTGTTP